MRQLNYHLFSLLFLTLLLLSGGHLQAQVSATERTMSRGTNNALVLDAPGYATKDVEKLWSDYTKDTFKEKSKTNRKTKEMETLNVPMTGGGNVDIYSKVEKRGDGSELVVWVATPDGYVGPRNTPNRYVEAEKMLLRFALVLTSEQIKEELDQEEDELKDIEKDLQRMERDKERAQEDIEKAKQTIIDAEAAIEQNDRDQETARKAIEEQQKVIAEVQKRLSEVEN